MEIIIFGAPGVGKGTQAKILSTQLNIPHISTGDILRDAISKGTVMGLKAKELVENGELVPDDIVAGIVDEVLTDSKSRKGFILDGFPRTLDQAKLLQPILEKNKIKNYVILFLNAEDEIIINRLSQRRLCTNCKSIVSLKDIINGNKCPKCASVDTLIRRKDDDVEVITRRVELFHNTTAPVIDYYKEKVKVIIIDGTKSIKEVSDRIKEELGII
ncbi:MAG TPA: adenylate kinase [Melioribacteraceae bacterium]|nr:adenylate kinase [Melioribacteraceae bacterium]